MSSGKSRESINVYLNELQSSEENRPFKKVIMTKNATDTRDPTIHTRDGRTRSIAPDLTYNSAEEFEVYVSGLEPSEHILVVDEYQFPTEGDIAGLLDLLATKGFEIYVSTLQTSFNGVPFGEHVKDIFSYADKVVMYKATCTTCKKDKGIRTLRTDNKGNPDKFDAPVVNVGFDNYNPVCRKDHVVPNKPQHKFYSNLEDFKGDGEMKVFSGPASSGKSEHLKAENTKYASIPDAPKYYTSPPELERLSKSPRIILIDNYHKLNSKTEEYATFLDEMARRGYIISVAGDPLTPDNLPTDSMRELLPFADEVLVGHAYEKLNGDIIPATKTIEVNGTLKPLSRYSLNLMHQKAL